MPGVVVVEETVNRVDAVQPRLDVLPPLLQPWSHINSLVILGFILAVPADPTNVNEVRGHINTLGEVDVIGGNPADVTVL